MNIFKYFLILVLVFFLFSPLRIMGNNNITAREIVNRIDKNMVPSSIQHRSKMIIYQGKRIDEKEMLGFAFVSAKCRKGYKNSRSYAETKYDGLRFLL